MAYFYCRTRTHPGIDICPENHLDSDWNPSLSLCNGNSFCTLQCNHLVWSLNPGRYSSPCPAKLTSHQILNSALSCPRIFLIIIGKIERSNQITAQRSNAWRTLFYKCGHNSHKNVWTFYTNSEPDYHDGRRGGGGVDKVNYHLVRNSCGW